MEEIKKEIKLSELAIKKLDEIKKMYNEIKISVLEGFARECMEGEISVQQLYLKNHIKMLRRKVTL